MKLTLDNLHVFYTTNCFIKKNHVKTILTWHLGHMYYKLYVTACVLLSPQWLQYGPIAWWKGVLLAPLTGFVGTLKHKRWCIKAIVDSVVQTHYLYLKHSFCFTRVLTVKSYIEHYLLNIWICLLNFFIVFFFMCCWYCFNLKQINVSTQMLLKI